MMINKKKYNSSGLLEHIDDSYSLPYHPNINNIDDIAKAFNRMYLGVYLDNLMPKLREIYYKDLITTSEMQQLLRMLYSEDSELRALAKATINSYI